MIDIIGCAIFYIMFALFIIMSIWLVNKAYKLQAEAKEMNVQVIEVVEEELPCKSMWQHINEITAVGIMCIVYLLEKGKKLIHK